MNLAQYSEQLLLNIPCRDPRTIAAAAAGIGPNGVGRG